MMQTFTIIEDGDFDIPEILWNITWAARRSDYTVVQIISNEDSATVTFGFSDADEDFVAFPGGEISTGKKIEHGYGCRLMVRVSGITTHSVEIGLSTSGK